MTEASGGSGGSSRAEMERRLINRSLEDEGFRKRLPDDPKPVGYFDVADIKASLQALIDQGAQVQDVQDVGGGKLTAIATDRDGNPIGLSQEP